MRHLRHTPKARIPVVHPRRRRARRPAAGATTRAAGYVHRVLDEHEQRQRRLEHDVEQLEHRQRLHDQHQQHRDHDGHGRCRWDGVQQRGHGRRRGMALQQRRRRRAARPAPARARAAPARRGQHEREHEHERRRWGGQHQHQHEREHGASAGRRRTSASTSGAGGAASTSTSTSGAGGAASTSASTGTRRRRRGHDQHVERLHRELQRRGRREHVHEQHGDQRRLHERERLPAAPERVRGGHVLLRGVRYGGRPVRHAPPSRPADSGRLQGDGVRRQRRHPARRRRHGRARRRQRLHGGRLHRRRAVEPGAQAWHPVLPGRRRGVRRRVVRAEVQQDARLHGGRRRQRGAEQHVGDGLDRVRVRRRDGRQGAHGGLGGRDLLALRLGDLGGRPQPLGRRALRHAGRLRRRAGHGVGRHDRLGGDQPRGGPRRRGGRGRREHAARRCLQRQQRARRDDGRRLGVLDLGQREQRFGRRLVRADWEGGARRSSSGRRRRRTRRATSACRASSATRSS